MKPEVKVEIGGYKVVEDQLATRVIGYVENKGNTPVEDIQVAASLLGSDGKTVASDQSIYERNVLPPGERSPFLVMFSQKPSGWESEKLQVQAKPLNPRSFAAGRRAEGLKVEDSSLNPPANQFAGFTVSGQVKNEGDKVAEGVEVIAILYDAEGQPLGVGQTYTDLKEIAPNDTAPFSIDFYNVKEGAEEVGVFPQGRVKQ